jgi:hypothetical protein
MSFLDSLNTGSGSASGGMSAASSLLGGYADLKAGNASAKVLRGNADTMRTNAELTANSTSLRVMQQQRKAYQVLGGQRADIAGAGLAASGSALDVIRSSAQQSSVDKSLIQMQGQIDVNSMTRQAQNYDAQAKAAQKAGKASFFGSIGKILGTIVGGPIGGDIGGSLGSAIGGS